MLFPAVNDPGLHRGGGYTRLHVMTTTLSIDGMSCGHCVAAVKQALDAVPGVTVKSVTIGAATVESADPAPIDAMRLAIEDAGYFAEVK